MIAAIAPVGALLLSVALLLTGNGLQGTLLPVRASLENFGELSIGVLGASYYSGFVLGCMMTPQLIRRVGHIRVFAAMVAVARSEEHTSELQSLMRISYAVLCVKKKK